MHVRRAGIVVGTLTASLLLASCSSAPKAPLLLPESITSSDKTIELAALAYNTLDSAGSGYSNVLERIAADPDFKARAAEAGITVELTRGASTVLVLTATDGSDSQCTIEATSDATAFGCGSASLAALQ